MVKPKSPQKKKSTRDIARKRRAEVVKAFAKKVLGKFGKYVKCIVLVGSVARDEFTAKSDIDIFIVVDDTKSPVSQEMKQKLDDEIDAMAESVSKDLVVQPPYLLTEFWEMVRTSHPLIYNFIRDGIPVYDVGFFAPIKRLLEMGKIPATPEAIQAQIEKAPKRIKRVKEVKIYMVSEDCYYSMIDMVQAVLMSMGFAPPAPYRAAEEFRRHVVDAGMVDEKYAQWLHDVNEFRKKVEHKEIKDVSGQEVDEWIGRTEEFVGKMHEVLTKLESGKKEKVIEKSYDVMGKAVAAALKSGGKAPADRTAMRAAFKQLVDRGVVSEQYLGVWDKLDHMKRKVAEGKIAEIPERDIYAHREYVRRFIHEVGKMLKEREKKTGKARKIAE